MLTEVILLYNFFTSAASWSSLASAHHRVHLELAQEKAHHVTEFYGCSGHALGSPLENVSANCWATCLYFVTLFSLSLPLLTTMLTVQEFPRLDWANHIGSQQDEIVFPGKVWQQLKLQRKQNIHNAARLRRKWFPINLMGLSASACNFLQKNYPAEESPLVFVLSFQRFHGKDHETPWLEWFVWSFVMQRARKLLARVRSGGPGSSLKSSRFHGFCLLPFLDEYCPRTHRLRFHRSSDPVKPKTPSLHVLQWPRCNMCHFCMDIRLRLFSSHCMVPRSLGQRTIMNVSSWIVFKLLARVTKLIFRSNIYLNSACLQKEEHVLARASCTNRQDTFMDVIARWIRAITLGKGRHFLTPWPMA